MHSIRIHAEDSRLKRRINHDPRSREYPLYTRGLDVVDVEWSMHIPIMDQGRLGKCTAEAATEILGSEPYWATLPPEVQSQLGDTWSDTFYHDETVADSYPGEYPPDDTGSDGLTSAKVAQARGLISGYQHTFTAEDALRGLQLYPFAWGTIWKSGMDAVNESTGEVTYTGTQRGGHELCAYKIDAKQERLWCHQSWGAWGYQRNGTFWISFADFGRSLDDEGDTTFFTPLTEPAPQPTPPSTLTEIGFTQDDVSFMDTWAAARHTRCNKTAAQTWQRGLR